MHIHIYIYIALENINDSFILGGNKITNHDQQL